jgi:cell division protein FtsB
MQMPSFFMFGKSNSLRVQQLARNHKSEIERLAGEHAAAITRLNRALEDERMRLEAEVASVKRELEELKRRRTYMTRSLMSRGATVRGSNSNNNSVTQVVRHGR